MTTSADFTLNGTPQSDGVYRATAGGTVDLEIADGLAIDGGVVVVSLERKTKNATDIAELATDHILSPATATLTLNIPNEVSSWLIRVQLNGGADLRGVQPTWTRERVIETVGSSGVAKQLAGEMTQRHPVNGWSDLQNDEVDAIDLIAGGDLSQLAANVALTAGGATVIKSLNVASVTRTAEGVCDVAFSHPLADADYGVVATARGASTPGFCLVHTPTTTGFVIERYYHDGSLRDDDFNFSVFLLA